MTAQANPYGTALGALAVGAGTLATVSALVAYAPRQGPGGAVERQSPWWPYLADVGASAAVLALVGWLVVGALAWARHRPPDG